MSKRMVTYALTDDNKIASIDGNELGAGGAGDKSISRRMISYKVDNGKIISIDGHELAGGGGGEYEIKPLEVTANGVYDVAGEAYKPVRVNVPQTAASGSVKALLDARQSAAYLFYKYEGASVDGLISNNDTANVTSFAHMFDGCSNLLEIPTLNTSAVADMGYMFYNCSKLTTIPPIDTSKVTNMHQMFCYCARLTEIPALDASSSNDIVDIFFGSPSLEKIGIYGFTRSINILNTKLQHDALVAFLNQAGNAYNSSQKITMGPTKLALLSDEEKAIATNKGWTLA